MVKKISYCPICGKKIIGNLNQCPSCSSKLIVCRNCAKLILSSANKCQFCSKNPRTGKSVELSPNNDFNEASIEKLKYDLVLGKISVNEYDQLIKNI